MPEAKESLPYRVLARKYRPVDFTTLVGQEAMVRTLRNAIARAASRMPSCSPACAASARPRPPASSPGR